jgi:thiol-disulfide isomerase/thioredoxin
MNKMLKNSLVVMILFGFQYLMADAKTPSYFEKGNINEVMKKAGAEGKLYFVDFYADWCTPCKWMDQTVFADKEIEQALTASYIPIKVNIDDIDGFEMKQKYKISVLPTIMIFNSKGIVVERVEETLNVEELLQLLSLHDNPDNKVKIQHNLNVKPGSVHDEFSKREMNQAYLRYIESESNNHKNYRLQLGTFTDHESAFNKVETLKKVFLEPIIVINDMKDGQVRFKVMMGEFASMMEAESFQKILSRDFSLDSIIN